MHRGIAIFRKFFWYDTHSGAVVTSQERDLLRVTRHVMHFGFTEMPEIAAIKLTAERKHYPDKYRTIVGPGVDGSKIVLRHNSRTLNLASSWRVRRFVVIHGLVALRSQQRFQLWLRRDNLKYELGNSSNNPRSHSSTEPKRHSLPSLNQPPIFVVVLTHGSGTTSSDVILPQG